MRTIVVLLVILIIHLPAHAKLTADWPYVEKQLKAAGFKKDFIAALHDEYIEKDLETVIKLNVLLFLKKTNYHGVQVTDNGVKNIRSFLETHKDILIQTEKDYGVKPSVIASLLWMETRHGANYGKFHVPSVFLHLLQSERKEVLAFLQANAAEFDPNVTQKNRRNIVKRTRTKAKWALQELKALQWLFQKDPQRFKALYGSFSGAFGMPQFLPSSYKHWARTPKKNLAPDLFSAEDSIYSVGHYLKSHKWKPRKPKTHVSTLMRYNNSRDYAEAILKMSELADSKK